MEESCYRSDEKGFPMRVIGGFGVEETLGFFRELGIEPKDRNGYVYPNSDQASSVLDVLLWEASHERVDIRTSCKVETIEWIKGENNSFYYKICTTQGIFRADALILATGSRLRRPQAPTAAGTSWPKSLGTG